MEDFINIIKNFDFYEEISKLPKIEQAFIYENIPTGIINKLLKKELKNETK